MHNFEDTPNDPKMTRPLRSVNRNFQLGANACVAPHTAPLCSITKCPYIWRLSLAITLSSPPPLPHPLSPSITRHSANATLFAIFCYPLLPLPILYNKTFLFDANIPTQTFNSQCMTAECLGGPDRCFAINGVGYFTLVMTFIVVIAIGLVIAQFIYLGLSLQKKKQLKFSSAMGMTILFATMGLLFDILWTLSFILEVFSGNDDWYNSVGGTIGVPGQAFSIAAALSVSIM